MARAVGVSYWTVRNWIEDAQDPCGQMKRIPYDRLPAEPFRRLIEQAIEEEEDIHSAPMRHLGKNPQWRNGMSGYAIVAERIARYGGIPRETVTRWLHRLRTNRFIRFDRADLILCALDKVDLWFRDPVLSDIYRRVRMPRSDRCQSK